MNKEINKILLKLLSKSGIELYNKRVEDIRWDTQNIKYLIDFITSNKDSDVSLGIIQFIKEKYGIESENIDDKLLPKLIKFHDDNFDEELRTTHEAINITETFAENVCLYQGTNRELDFINAFFDKLGEMVVRVNTFSDFVMNFCAIQYIRRNMDIRDFDKVIKKYKIDIKFYNVINMSIINIEFLNILQKLARFIYAYDGKDYEEKIELSLYDAKVAAERFVSYGMNNVAKDLLTWLNNSCCEYDSYKFMINTIAMYSAIWDSALLNSKYQVSLDYYIKDFYFYLVSPIGEIFKDEANNINSDLIKSYELCRKSIDDNEIIASTMNIKKMYNFFKNNVCEWNFDTFKVWYIKTVSEINDLIKD